MWLALRELPAEHRFRRQHPIGSYVVDFACPGRKLAIELDGGQHAQQEEDAAARTLEIARRGYRVIRFWNNDVMHNLAGVLEVIRRELECPLCPSGGEGATRRGVNRKPAGLTRRRGTGRSAFTSGEEPQAGIAVRCPRAA
jgi:very-short-patch-repair endonuclease